MTTFYSSSIQRKVNVPDSKVCGYKMRNEYNKRGFSSGLKAGRNNGVVNQKLSRFATDYDAEVKHQCPGNTNWNNYDGPDFMKTRGGSAFSLERPAYREGTSSMDFQAQKMPKQIRAGLGNRDITRANFLSPDIRPRNAIDFDKLQAIDIETQGAKIQLSDKTIAELFKTKIPDPQDVKWIAERDRMRTAFQLAGLTPAQIEIELNTNKPLGREQRKINGQHNIGQSTLSMGDKLHELEQEVKDGRAESRVQQATIIGQFALVLADTNAIAGLTQLQLSNLGQALARVGVPTTHKRLGLIPRFVDNDFYLANAGLINLLLFSKVRETPNTVQYNYDQMVLNFTRGDDNGMPGIKLSSMVSLIRRQIDRRYIDLHRGGIITLNQMRAAVGAIPGGFASPDVDIQLANQ